MYLEYKYDNDKETVKNRLNEYTDKLENMRFEGGFAVEDFKKSWTDDEMQVSLNLRKSAIERRIKGNIKVKEKILIMDLDLPDIIKNLVTEENIEKTIRKNLDTILGI